MHESNNTVILAVHGEMNMKTIEMNKDGKESKSVATCRTPKIVEEHKKVNNKPKRGYETNHMNC